MVYKRTRIKFCGMTSVADALLAAELGVDAIGLIFYSPSLRNVSLDNARMIANSMPPFISKVGVVVNENRATIQSILDSVPLDILQFHGQESSDYCRSFGKPYIKTIHIDQMLNEDIEHQYEDAVALLLDTKTQHLPGGSGVTFDWKYIPATLTKPIILAGGLTVDNIDQALRQVKPYAVDVTSGIEREKGMKDQQKMSDFINRVLINK